MIINDGILAVPDSILNPYHIAGQSDKVRLALEALEAYNDDRLGWHLYADIPTDRYLKIIASVYRERFRSSKRRKRKPPGDPLPGLG